MAVSYDGQARDDVLHLDPTPNQGEGEMEGQLLFRLVGLACKVELASQNVNVGHSSSQSGP
jgi:hypothetical protein